MSISMTIQQFKDDGGNGYNNSLLIKSTQPQAFYLATDCSLSKQDIYQRWAVQYTSSVHKNMHVDQEW